MNIKTITRASRATAFFNPTFLTGLLFSWALAAQAAPVSPVSYDMPNGGTGTYRYHDESYTGSGNTSVDCDALSGGLGDLTDGITGSAVLPDQAAANPWVAWRSISGFPTYTSCANPTITFHFSEVTSFNTVTISTWDNDGGSIGMPASATVQVNGNAPRVFPLVNPPGQGVRVIDLDMMGDIGDTVSVTLFHTPGLNYQWLFVDEISFDANLGWLQSGTATPFVGPSQLRGDWTCATPHQCEFQAYDTFNNLAYTGNGAAPAVAKDGFGAVLHQPQFLNDGNYGNGSSWVAASSNSWLKIDLGAVSEIGAIKLGRDRIFNGTLFDDRDIGNFTIELADTDNVYANGDDSNDSSEYTQVFASSFDGLVDGEETLTVNFPTPLSGRYLKINTGYVAPYTPAIDEVEVLAPFVYLPGATERVSIDSSELEGNGATHRTSVSDDGRYVAFFSDASNLVPGDTNGRTDVFVRDREAGTTERVSVSSAGSESNGWSYNQSISDDGRYVAFQSSANNLVPGDTNNQVDAFVHDRATGMTERVSVDSLGNQASQSSAFPFISGNGRYVAFVSNANNLVAGDANGQQDIFVHDRVTDTTELVSVASSGVQANAWSGRPTISDDGRYVAFESGANNLVPGDSNNVPDVFVHDRATGSTERVSVDSLGNQADQNAGIARISGNGRYVVYYSTATNLVAGDTNSTADVFVHDRGTGITTRVSVNESGGQLAGNSYEPSVSDDGRYIAFHSNDSNVVSGDTNRTTDAFVHDRATGENVRVSVDSLGAEGDRFSNLAVISGNGRHVSFISQATNLVAGDTNSQMDGFVHDLGALSNTPPTASASANPNPAECGQDITFSGAGSSDADGTIVAWTWSGDISGSGVEVITGLGLGSWSVNLMVEDDGGLTDSTTITGSVVDTTPPVVSAGGDQALEATSSSGAPYTLSYSVTDTCDPSPSSSVLPVYAIYPIGTTGVTVTGRDDSGNEASDTADITVRDTTAPDVTVPGDITEEATSPSGNAIAFSASANDIVDGTLTPTCSPASGDTFPIMTTEVTCSVPDAAGNIGSAGFNVTVRDTTAPVLTLPGDQTVEATGPSGAVASFSASATDIADASPDVDCVPPSGSTFVMGDTTVNCTATDDSGNEASGSFEVSVVDTTPPTVTPPSDQTVEATSASGAIASWVIADAVDLVDGAITPSCSPASGSAFALGTTGVSCSATDAAGNTGSAGFNITVKDTTAPVLTVPADMLLEAAGPLGAVATFSASATDLVDASPDVACLPASGGTFAIGTTTVNCTATDDFGNQSGDSFDVTVVDTTPPVVTPPSDQTIEATSASGAIATFSASATDIVDGAVATSCAPPSGSTFPLGSTTVTCSATDAAGNTGQATATITVEDTTPPAVTPPADQTIEATSASGAIASWVIADAVDLVDGAITPSCSPVSGSTFPLGSTTVVCSAKDAAGNEGSASFSITVEDTTPPVVTPPDDITTTATKPAGADVSWTIADAVDIVDGNITPTCTPASGSTFGHGTSTVNCEAKDEAGNTGTASFSVTVLNARPTADAQSVNLDEDTSLAITLTGNDVDDYPVTPLVYEVVSGPSNGDLTGTAPNLGYAPDQHFYGDDSFTFRTFDGDLYSDTVTVNITVDPVNDAPVITISRATAGMQYSDTIGTVTITATDVDDDPLTLGESYTFNGGAPIAGLPSALSTTGGCDTDTDNNGASPRAGTDCTWTFSGQALVPSGDYDVSFTVTDAGGGEGAVLSATGATELLVAAENASIAFDGNNPVAVQVVADGVDESEPFSIVFDVWETTPDNAAFTAQAGDISNAIPEVGIQLTPVGPGSPVSPVAECAVDDNNANGYAEVLTFTCAFDAVPVNTYSVDVSINGGYYTGSDDDVLTVYDPSLGFTTGGGWFYWPGTTDKTNFGYTMKYNKKRTNIQGSLLMIRHIEGAPEGFDKWRVKSNSLEGLSLGDETDFGWAAFNGKATYKAPGADNEGNHEFTILAEDHGEPGAGLDRIWIQTRDKIDDVVADLSMDEPAVDEAVIIEGGNIVVPHGNGGGGAGGGGKGKNR